MQDAAKDLADRNRVGQQMVQLVVVTVSEAAVVGRHTDLEGMVAVVDCDTGLVEKYSFQDRP